jgi:hypothetical protein
MIFYSCDIDKNNKKINIIHNIPSCDINKNNKNNKKINIIHSIPDHILERNLT